MRNGWIRLALVLAAACMVAFIFLFRPGGIFRGSQAMQAKQISYRGHTFDWVRIDPTKHEINLYWKDNQGRAFSTFGSLAEHVESKGASLLFATNAGIFSSDITPGGLHVEQGIELHRLNLRDGEGNFHLKPNGVFFVENGTAQVMESTAYSLKARRPRVATQSGPMLVIDGSLHPAFTQGSDNRNIRNGVGVDKNGYVHFAVSNDRVNFHDFASLFLEALKCPNALYLDGSISDIYLPSLGRTPNGSGYCGILGVEGKKN